MMARYFLHLRDGTDEVLDLEGTKYGSLGAVQAATLDGARDLMREDLRTGRLDLGFRIDAEDDMGIVVHSLSFAHAIEILRQPQALA